MSTPKEAANTTLARLATECEHQRADGCSFLAGASDLAVFANVAIRLTEALSNPASYVHRDVSPDDSTS